MSKQLEALDRRAFLRGMMVTSAGLLVPKPARVFVPAEKIYEPPTLVMLHTEWSGDFTWAATVIGSRHVMEAAYARMAP